MLGSQCTQCSAHHSQAAASSACGAQALYALALYRDARFCLSPPGDTVARAAIADALAVGCVPVIFHPAQRRLWPWHWDAASASVFAEGWAGSSGGGDEHGDEAGSLARRAAALMQQLLSMPPARELALRRAGARVAASMVYAGEQHAAQTEDAIEVLVRGLAAGRTVPHSPGPPGFVPVCA